MNKLAEQRRAMLIRRSRLRELLADGVDIDPYEFALEYEVRPPTVFRDLRSVKQEMQNE